MSSAASNRFFAAISAWVNAITSSVKTGAKPIVNEQITLTAGQTKTYNLATLIGATAGDYALASADIQAKVLDSDSGSPTYNYFVNAETIIRVGVKTTGEVIVQNFHTATVTVRVRISYPARND